MKSKWKKNILLIPENVLEQVKQLNGNNIVAACVLKIRTEDIKNGEFLHLDIEIEDGNLKFPEQILPRPEVDPIY